MDDTNMMQTAAWERRRREARERREQRQKLKKDGEDQRWVLTKLFHHAQPLMQRVDGPLICGREEKNTSGWKKGREGREDDAKVEWRVECGITEYAVAQRERLVVARGKVRGKGEQEVDEKA